MRFEVFSVTGLVAVSVLAGGCDWMPGKPKYEDRWQPPSAVVDFATLYSQNCRGCHGDGETVAGSITLKNPVYLAAVPAEALREATAHGVEGGNMPAFSHESGGELTDEQLDVLVNGILAWKDPAALPAAPIPAYAGPLGDVAAGGTAFGVSCASCHGADGTGGEKAGSVVDPAYLGQVSNQYLRTVTIAGRPELGCPNFAERVPGQALDDKSVADLVAWMASHRRNEFGQPLTPPQRSTP